MCAEKILIIAGDPELCDEAADFFWEEGFAVETALDTEGGLKRMDGNEFDIVLLDQKMAGRGGMETERRIKALAPGTRVFVADAGASCQKFAADIASLRTGTASGKPAKTGGGL